MFWTGALAQIMVDAEDRRLGEHAEQNPVELLRRREIVAERLLDDDACALAQPDCTKLLDHRLKQARRNRQVVRRPLAAPSSLRSASNVAGSW